MYHSATEANRKERERLTAGGMTAFDGSSLSSLARAASSMTPSKSRTSMRSLSDSFFSGMVMKRTITATIMQPTTAMASGI